MKKKEYNAIVSIYEKMINRDLYQRFGGCNYVEVNEYEFEIAQKLSRIPAVLSLRLGDGSIEYKYDNLLLPASFISFKSRYFIEIFEDVDSQITTLNTYLLYLRTFFATNYQNKVTSIFDIDIDDKRSI